MLKIREAEQLATIEFFYLCQCSDRRAILSSDCISRFLLSLPSCLLPYSPLSTQPYRSVSPHLVLGLKVCDPKC